MKTTMRKRGTPAANDILARRLAQMSHDMGMHEVPATLVEMARQVWGLTGSGLIDTVTAADYILGQ